MRHFLKRVLNILWKHWIWISLIFCAILVKIASFYPYWIETHYSLRIYPGMAAALRFMFGWMPFSFGDLFYGFLIVILIIRTLRFFKILFTRRAGPGYVKQTFLNTGFIIIVVYVSFNFLWGMNYDRLGIAQQLNLEMKKYSLPELDTLVAVLEDRLNFYAKLAGEPNRDSFYDKQNLFHESAFAYQLATKKYSFLRYRPASVKPSIFSYAGNVLGFDGYYNPFSGEAQVNTTIPVFLRPFVTCHEIGHQVGYAKENEANFAGFLACRLHPSPVFRYSVYFDMFNYAIRELHRKDSLLAKQYISNLDTQVKKDYAEVRRFYRKYENPIEPLITWSYGNYLKANNQPAGRETYSQVVAFLIAYQRKYGKESI